MKIKRSLLVIFAVCVAALCLCSCTKTKDAWSKDDFQLTVDVPKTKMTVGETMEISATLKNISGYDAPTSSRGIGPGIYIRDLTDTTPNLLPDIRKIGTMEKDKVYSNTQTFTPDTAGRYIVEIHVEFTMRTKNKEKIEFNPDPIYIDVE